MVLERIGEENASGHRARWVECEVREASEVIGKNRGVWFIAALVLLPQCWLRGPSLGASDTGCPSETGLSPSSWWQCCGFQAQSSYSTGPACIDPSTKMKWCLQVQLTRKNRSLNELEITNNPQIKKQPPPHTMNNALKLLKAVEKFAKTSHATSKWPTSGKSVTRMWIFV